MKHGDGVIVGAVGVLAAPHLWDFDGEVIHGGGWCHAEDAGDGGCCYVPVGVA